ncbi:MAG: hypothetical protein JRC86_00440 [Deltaproteobacteria bacterium]|nr:hypothetical protein [Deltaproteobacteria bacterium]
MRYLWEWFCDISNGRDYGENGPKPITYTELRSWAKMAKTDPTAWEVSAIRTMDGVYLNEARKS